MIGPLLTACAAFQAPGKLNGLQQTLQKLPAAAVAFSITTHANAVHAKSVIGVNGGLDFGPLAGDQPGGEGTGKVRVCSAPPLTQQQQRSPPPPPPPPPSRAAAVRLACAQQRWSAALLRRPCPPPGNLPRGCGAGCTG